MAVAYYPVQKVNFGGEIKGVQSVGIDFDAKNTEFYEFGKNSRIGYAPLEAPTVSAKIQYILNKGATNSNIFSDFLSPSSASRSCTLKFRNGQMIVSSGEIVNYSLKGQVGSFLIGEIDILGLNATYSASSSPAGIPSTTGVFSPTKLTLGEIPLRSFSLNISIPKTLIYRLSSETPDFFNFGKPKLFFEAEYILGTQNSSLPLKHSQIALSSDGTSIFTYNGSNLEINKHSTQNSVTDVGTVKATYEALIMNPTDIDINY